MNSHKILIPLLFIAMLFAGCPYYTSTVPIEKPSVPVKDEFLGVWEDPTSQNHESYAVGKYNNYVYKIEKVLNDSSDRQEKYLAYLSNINDTSFLNVRIVNSFNPSIPDTTPERYFFMKLDHKGGLISLSGVTKNITEKFTSSEELKEFIKINMKNSYFYDKEEHLLINKYQIEKNEKQVIQLTKDKALRELQLEKSKSFGALMLSALIFVVAISLFLWFYIINKQNTNKLILEKKEISAMLSGQESERRRIATDLHDRLGSMLATVKLYFNSVEEHLEILKKDNREQYTKATKLLDEACDEVRKISHDLSRGILTRFGIVAALNELKDNVSQSNQLNMTVSISGMEDRLPQNLETALFSIIQELTGNVIKHANAKNLIVILKRNSNRVLLRVEDDGKGFDMKSKESGDGMGLNSIRMRVTDMNGKFNITAEGKSATVVIIEIPLS